MSSDIKNKYNNFSGGIQGYSRAESTDFHKMAAREPKVGYSPLKGQSHEIFCTRFFPQTTPPGPIRDVLGPFRFFCFLAEL